MPIPRVLFSSELILYIFFGILTTAVTFMVFFLFHGIFGMEPNTANVISIISAIIFAFWVNKLFVFKKLSMRLTIVAREAAAFAAARALSMVMEVGGFYMLYSIAGMPEYPAKIGISILVVAVNYLLSKFIIFKQR